eukprot:gene29967-36193_t
MEQLIPVVNKLQDVFGAIGQEVLDLPQIVVVGSQSAGKSSVLESIVGRDFLPRGIGIVTRRPLVLQLYCINPDEIPKEDLAKGDEWGEFLHLPKQKFFNFDEIRDEIIRETDRVTGRNKGLSNKSINLRIFSPFVLNLTLVDLPGITKVPTGDQPEDVEEQIKAMCLEFIRNPNAIILAVTAANQDLANSDGLKLAREVDPLGERTVGVLTKADIMDHGTDCCDILSNQVIPLKKGYIAIKNRSQRDIQDNVTVRQGIAKETAYFQEHPRYRQMLSKCGTRNLARTLNQILMVHIKEVLPEIKTRISKMLVGVTANLESLGDSLDDTNAAAKGGILLRILSQFSENFRNKVEGKGSSELTMEMKELYGGARISHIFNEIFGKRLRQLDPFEGLEDEDIRTAIANANGTRPSLFVPEISFDLLVKRQIARLEQPGLQCLDMIVHEMQRMINQSDILEWQRFPDLKEKTMEVIHSFLRSCVAPAQRMIHDLIQIELAYINTSHPDFVGGKAAVTAAQQAQQVKLNKPAGVGDGPGNGGGAMPAPAPSLLSSPPPAAHPSTSMMASPPPPDNKGFMGYFPSNPPPRPAPAPMSTSVTNPGQGGPSGRGGGGYDEFKGIRLPAVAEKLRCANMPTDRERTETEIIKTLIRSYFDIVKKNYVDLVPKTIMRFLVLAFKENLQNHLVAELYKEQIMSQYMKETEEIASKRRAFREMRDLLHRANEIVNEIRDFQPSA